MNEFSDLSTYAINLETGGLHGTGMFGTVVDESGCGTQQRNGVNVISAMWVYSWKGIRFGRAVRVQATVIASDVG